MIQKQNKLQMRRSCSSDIRVQNSRTWQSRQVTFASKMIQRDLRISSKWHPRPKASSATFVSQAQQLGLRLQHQISIASQTSNKSRVQSKFASKVEKHESRIFINERCVLSQRKKYVSIYAVGSTVYWKKTIDSSTDLTVHWQDILELR